MLLAATVGLVSQLNAAAAGQVSAEVAAAAVLDSGLIQHVIDAEGLLELHPLQASDMTTAMAAAVAAGLRAGCRWQLALPRPGRLGQLRGPTELTERAVAAGLAVLPTAADARKSIPTAADGRRSNLATGVAWVPLQVGPAVQWQLTQAHNPGSNPGRADAERALAELVVEHGRRLSALGLTGGARPSGAAQLRLAPGYPARSVRAANRAADMLAVVNAARAGESELLHSHAIAVRATVLADLEAAAIDLLCAACDWPA